MHVNLERFDQRNYFDYHDDMIGSVGHQNTGVKRLVVIAVSVLIIATVVIFYVLRKSAASPTEKMIDKQASAGEITKQVIRKVGVHYKLPSDEQPTVAEIQDIKKLQDQPFFEDAREGDYLLVYKLDGTAIIYREKEDILITVGPINLEDTEVTQEQSNDQQ